jgi:hypothetical protein
MAQVIIQPKNAENLKSLVKTAVENQMRVLSYGIAKTKRKLEELEKETGLNSRDFYKKFRKGELSASLRVKFSSQTSLFFICSDPRKDTG